MRNEVIQNISFKVSNDRLVFASFSFGLVSVRVVIVNQTVEESQYNTR